VTVRNKGRKGGREEGRKGGRKEGLNLDMCRMSL